MGQSCRRSSGSRTISSSRGCRATANSSTPTTGSISISISRGGSRAGFIRPRRSTAPRRRGWSIIERCRSPGEEMRTRAKHGAPLRLLPLLTLVVACCAIAADPAKTLRVASPDIETLDPQQFSDNPSFEVLVAIFEPLYEWDYLRSPPKLSPVTAAGPLAITDGGKTWTMRVKPGIFFTDDAAFKGKPRELVAADYVYSYKRWLDPNLRRGGTPVITDLIVGARAVVDAARGASKFDYDRPIEGLRP